MNQNPDLIKKALTHIKLIAKDLNPNIEELKEIIGEVCMMKSLKSLDQNYLLDLIKLEVNIIYSGEGILDDKDKSHVEWLSDSGEPLKSDVSINWKFWNDYKDLMIEELPTSAINELNNWSNKILMRLENPSRSGSWSRKGLVVGEVQSGKTANYTALICKAADAGYKIIIVLAGLHNNLRAQTQDRLDESFIGFNSDKDDRNFFETYRIGVGNYKDHPGVYYLTTSNEKGDLSKATAQSAGVNLTNNPTPVILIVKKNKSIIENLTLWARRHGLRKGEKTIKNSPLLLIDDECDNASINTNKTQLKPQDIEDLTPKDEKGNLIKELDPTAINAGIRSLLNLFDQKAYVGYTATPYANILIHRQSYSSEYGDDLFPQSFILNLPIPSNYVGPVQFFGLDKDETTGIDEKERFPLYREISDYADFITEKEKDDTEKKNKKEFIVSDEIPESLKKAILSFIIGCAARMSRGMTHKHNSMLIHVTRYTSVQKIVAKKVQDFVDITLRRIKYGDGSSKSIMDELRNIWEFDFIKETSMKMMEASRVQSWSEIKPYIEIATDKLEKVKIINGSVKDILEYKKYKDIGINVIAIGGDKLSRGLTLEGLTVSYYLRAAKLYDTLMQMGRWFGYRPGYLDLCRLYTTQTLMGWYKHITLATVELKKEFDYMVLNDLEPSQYGLKIRSHPDVLSVTSLSKMRHGEKRKVSFNGVMVQTLFISLVDEHLKNNCNVTKKLLEGKESSEQKVGFIYKNISPQSIVDFLDTFIVHKRNGSFRSKYLIKYIQKLNEKNELINWTVAVMSTKDGIVTKEKIIPNELKMTYRGSGVDIFQDYVQFHKAILSKAHESIDLTDDELKSLISSDPTPKEIRHMRNKEKGLLLIYPLYGTVNNGAYGYDNYPVLGCVISFPATKNETEIEYIVDSLIAEEEFLEYGRS